MDLGLSLNLEQKQKLIMTPKLQLAIELLQFSSQDLEEYVEEEMQSNPLLEREEGDEDNELDKRLANQYYSSGYYGGSSGSDSEENSFENFISYQPNLIEHLERQLYLVLEEEEIEIGEYIIGNLDNDGFLTLTVEEISEKLGESKRCVSSVLTRIQYLDPVGIGARNLRESLLIQLDSLNLNTDLAEVIVANHLELVAEGKYREIIDLVAEKEDRVRGAINLIKTLDPRPAAGFNRDRNTKYITPDIIIKKVNGEFVITMNDKASPILRINPYYYKMMQKSSGGETYQFLRKKFKSALWLIKSIEQRRITVYRITRAIVEKQKEFLEQGIKYLKPMTMQEVADDIEMHESTVSRATSEKYIQTPQGMYELKFFFTSGINNISSISIKAMIGEYIDNEDKTSPLSDSKLAALLKRKAGIDVSRRTVAKYRNELGIESSVKRGK